MASHFVNEVLVDSVHLDSSEERFNIWVAGEHHVGRRLSHSGTIECSCEEQDCMGRKLVELVVAARKEA